jgi:hypothetical protein
VVGDPEMRSPQLAGLSIEPAQEAQHVLILKLGTSRFECILELDHPDFAINGGQLGPVHTLDCWMTELERLSTGDVPVVLLPFNFSDQCTGWLRVGPVRKGLVDVQAGWSLIGQYDFDSSDFIAAGRHVPDFEPVRNARIERPLADIVAAVAAARKALAESRDSEGMADSIRYHGLDEK